MAKAVLCPVCDGRGKVYQNTGTIVGEFDNTCHGCDGRGWVEVSEQTKVNEDAYYFDYPIWYSNYYPRCHRWPCDETNWYGRFYCAT